MKASKKAQKRLAARINGWTETLNRPENRTKDMSGYHKPGSNNK